jgi:hypothetical protein
MTRLTRYRHLRGMGFGRWQSWKWSPYHDFLALDDAISEIIN